MLTTGLDNFLGNFTHSGLVKSYAAVNYEIMLDYHLFYSKQKSGIILSLRYGFTTGIGDGNWKLNDSKISFEDPDKVRSSYFGLGVKLYVKMRGKSGF